MEFTTSSDAQTLIRSLLARSPEERTEAFRQMERLAEEDLSAFLKLRPLLQKAVHRELRNQGFRLAGILLLTPVTAYWLLPDPIYIPLTPLIFMGCLIVLVDPTKKRKSRAGEAESHFNSLRVKMSDLRLLPQLLAEMTNSAELTPSERTGLRLLPLLKASDTHILTKQTQKRLTNALWGNVHGQYTTTYDIGNASTARVLALLKAMEQVGTAEDLDIIEQILDQPCPHPNQKRVYAAAKACWPLLHERVTGEENRRTLLRGAAETPDPKTLLRPAHPIETPAEQLLRPGSSPAE